MHGGNIAAQDDGSVAPALGPTLAPGAALPRVRKPASVRCLGRVEISALAALVERLSDTVWQREDAKKENDYHCFHHTRHILFRFIEGNRCPWRHYSTPIWNVWRPWLLPVMRTAAAPFRFARPVFPKAMLARLQAGHGIDAHVDGQGSHPLTHRIHVPLCTNPQATLTVDGAQSHLRAGHAYEVNNLVVHSVHNGGQSDRIHFVFEVFDGAPDAEPESCRSRESSVAEGRDA